LFRRKKTYLKRKKFVILLAFEVKKKSGFQFFLPVSGGGKQFLPFFRTDILIDNILLYSHKFSGRVLGSKIYRSLFKVKNEEKNIKSVLPTPPPPHYCEIFTLFRKLHKWQMKR
jgi:hypothetical protein